MYLKDLTNKNRVPVENAGYYSYWSGKNVYQLKATIFVWRAIVVVSDSQIYGNSFVAVRFNYPRVNILLIRYIQ